MGEMASVISPRQIPKETPHDFARGREIAEGKTYHGGIETRRRFFKEIRSTGEMERYFWNVGPIGPTPATCVRARTGHGLKRPSAKVNPAPNTRSSAPPERPTWMETSRRILRVRK